MANWNNAFEQEPVDSAALTDGNEAIQATKVAVRERMEVEHEFGPNASIGVSQGKHKAGSAIIYSDSQPSTNPGGSALSSGDKGRLWYNTSAGRLYRWTGGGWDPIRTSRVFYTSTEPSDAIQGDLFYDTSKSSLSINTAATGSPENFFNISDGWDFRFTQSAANPNTTPPTRPSGQTISGSLDTGRLHIDTAAGKLYHYNGTGWDLVYTFNNYSISGTVTNKTISQQNADSVTQESVFTALKGALPGGTYIASGSFIYFQAGVKRFMTVSQASVTDASITIKGTRSGGTEGLVSLTFNNVANFLSESPTNVDDSTCSMDISLFGVS